MLRRINWISRTKLSDQLLHGIQLLIGHVEISADAVLIFKASPFIILATDLLKILPKNQLNQVHIHSHSFLANIQISIRGEGKQNTAVL
jgi:hypothetical protein